MACQTCGVSVKGESGVRSKRLHNGNHTSLRTSLFGRQIAPVNCYRQPHKTNLRSGQSIVCGAITLETNKKVPSKVPSNPWWRKDQQPNMLEVNSAQELVDVLACYNSKLVILDFYATWCGACRALYPKLVKLCKENSDIVLVKVNWEKNRDIAKGMGVKVLPYFVFYYGSLGKIAEFSVSVSRIQRLKDAIAEHTTPRCLLSPLLKEPVLKEFPDVHPGVENININISGNVVSFDNKITGLNEESQEMAFA